MIPLISEPIEADFSARQPIIENFVRRYYLNEEIEIEQKRSQLLPNGQSLEDPRRVGNDRSIGYESL